MAKETVGYYQSNIRTSRDKDGVHVMTYANQQLLIDKLQRENQELKKQLDELQTLYNNMFKCHCNRVQVETLLEQQKEFIEYLESEIDTIIQQKETFAELDAGQGVYLMTLAIALEKYKEIIGGKYEEDL